MDVFSAFPNAIVSEVWMLGTVERDTETGTTLSDLNFLDVIVDEVESAEFNTSPNAEFRESDTLIYAQPDQLPTTDLGTLQASYLWLNADTGAVYEIREAAIGKNQETGAVEHLEFILRETEVVDVDC